METFYILHFTSYISHSTFHISHFTFYISHLTFHIPHFPFHVSHLIKAMTETLPSEIVTRKALRGLHEVQNQAWQNELKSLDIGSRRLHKYKLGEEMEVIEKAAAIFRSEVLLECSNWVLHIAKNWSIPSSYI